MNEKQQIEKMAEDLMECFEQSSFGGYDGEFMAISYEDFAKLMFQKCYRKQEWISVDDRLPEEDGTYIVCVKNLTMYMCLERNVIFAEYIFNDFIFKGWEDNKVTHWMPLPEAPKMKGDTDEHSR